MGQLEYYYRELLKLGISVEDSKVIADSIVSQRSCSWINIEPVDVPKIAALNSFLDNKNLYAVVNSIPTRGKYIWDVKLKKK
ncbi:MAG: hypothetical protein ABII22_03610 [Candidatus Micrarchaeota archaeon]